MYQIFYFKLVCNCRTNVLNSIFVSSSGYKPLTSECDCVQRAQQAELSLLTLQYSMCRQHCWRLHYATAGGDQLNPVSGDMNQYWSVNLCFKVSMLISIQRLILTFPSICRPKDPPANFLSVLQKLESDYNELRENILEGVPLEQLKPLSVDCEKITTAATYIPAQARRSQLTQ